MDKKQLYKVLIEDVKKDYAKNPRKTSKDVTVEWTEACQNHINLWSYWQGSLDARILLVGQDWGHYSAFDKKPKDIAKYNAEKIMLGNFKKMNSGEDANYYDGINVETDKIFITDRNLVHLFEVLGKHAGGVFGDLSKIDKEKNSSLFFTNLCLGYRNNGSSGNCLTSWLTEDYKYFERLFDIIQPDVVLCLGKLTYETIASGMNNDKVHFSYDKLDKNANYVDVERNGRMSRIFGLAHPGGMGTANRKSKSKLYGKSSMSGMELMITDWENIGKYLAVIK